MKRTLLFFFFLLLCLPAQADFETWMMANAKGALSGKWLGYFEIQNRISENSRGQDRLLVRPAVGYQFARRHSAWLGYAWTPTFYPAYRDEQRFWQQTLAEYAWGDWSLVFRFRMEQRFIEGGGAMLWRWRELVRVAYAFSPSWSLVFWDEFFFSLNANAVAKKGFDQNRAFLGPEFSIGEGLRLQTGYMNVLVRRGGGVTANHILSATLTWEFNSAAPEPLPADADKPLPQG